MGVKFWTSWGVAPTIFKITLLRWLFSKMVSNLTILEGILETKFQGWIHRVTPFRGMSLPFSQKQWIPTFWHQFSSLTTFSAPLKNIFSEKLFDNFLHQKHTLEHISPTKNMFSTQIFLKEFVDLVFHRSEPGVWVFYPYENWNPLSVEGRRIAKFNFKMH